MTDALGLGPISNGTTGNLKNYTCQRLSVDPSKSTADGTKPRPARRRRLILQIAARGPYVNVFWDSQSLHFCRHLMSISFDSNVYQHVILGLKHLFGDLGIFTHYMFPQFNEIPKTHILASNDAVCEWSPRLVIFSRMCGGAPIKPIIMESCAITKVTNMMNRANLSVYVRRGLVSAKGWI